MTFASAVPHLLRLKRHKTPDMLRRLCGCPRDHVAHPVSPAAADVADLQWSVCPWWLLDLPHFRVIDTMGRLAKQGIQPRGELAAWVVYGLMATG